MRERIITAMAVVDKACYEFASGGIPAEDLVVLNKYKANGMIKFTKAQLKIGENLFLPLMADPAMRGIYLKLWVKMVVHGIAKYGINSKFGESTAATYFSNFDLYSHKYGIVAIQGLEYDELKSACMVISNDDLSPLEKADDMGIYNELIEGEDNE